MPGYQLNRKKIRDNIKALLLGSTGAGSNVFTSRINKAFIEELPGIFIFTTTDTPIISRKLEQNFPRKVSVSIEVLVAENEESQTIQDEADVIAGEVEDILLSNIYLQNPPPADRYIIPAPPEPGECIVNYIQLVGTDLAKTDDIQEDVYGISLEFECEYMYETATIDTIKDFNRFGHDYKTVDEIAENLTEIPIP